MTPKVHNELKACVFVCVYSSSCYMVQYIVYRSSSHVAQQHWVLITSEVCLMVQTGFTGFRGVDKYSMSKKPSQL